MKTSWPCLLLLAATLALAPDALRAQPRSFSALVKAQRQKVVHIGISGEGAMRTEPDPTAPFQYPEPREGMGSGFILSPDGLIVTNHHVVAHAGEIRVVLANEDAYRAEVIGVDPRTDLALLKIDAQDLPTVRFGNSDRLEVGDWVVAIGNPLGLDHSVTAGIISAKGRNIFNAENVAYGEFLQTDAAINPGNSGGPLFNLAGEVIGVNTAISRHGQGIGFAVPSNLVVSVVEQLQAHGRVIRGWLGVVIQDVTGDLAASLRLPPKTRGVVVKDILPGTPAAASALRKGDVLTAFGATRLRKVPQLQKLVALTKPGAEVQIDALRRGTTTGEWRRTRVSLRIGSAPEDETGTAANALVPLGLRLADLPPELRNRAGLKEGIGVLVQRVRPHSPAAEAGLIQGDIVVEANNRPVGSVKELLGELEKVRGGKLTLLVHRDRKVLFIALPLPG